LHTLQEDAILDREASLVEARTRVDARVVSSEREEQMPKRRPEDPLGQYNFHVEIEGVNVAYFRAVSGLPIECEPIEYMNGDDGTIRKRPGRIKVSNITLKRGFADKSNNPLWHWWEAVANGKVERKFGSIVLQNDAGGEVCRYNFTEGWPVKWKGWDLDGMGNTAVIEEIELCCETLKRVSYSPASGQ